MPEPGNPQDLNRYAYARNSPLVYTDPSGHLSNDEIMELFGVDEWKNVLKEFREGGRLEGRWGFLLMLGQLQQPYGVVRDPAKMARLYDTSDSRPYGEFDHGYPQPGDTLLMTISAKQIEGRLGLVEHLADGSITSVSVFDAGLVGDIWTAYDGQREERLGQVGIGGHGFLAGTSGNYVVTFDPNRFDSIGAWLDGGGLVASVIWPPAGAAAGCIEVARSWPKFAIPLVRGAPSSKLSEPFWDLALDIGGLFSPAADIIDLYTNFRSGAQADQVP